MEKTQCLQHPNEPSDSDGRRCGCFSGCPGSDGLVRIFDPGNKTPKKVFQDL